MAEHSKRKPNSYSGRRRVKERISRSAVTLVALGVAVLFAATPAYADQTYPTMNDSGGIYWRSAPDWNTPIQVSGYGIYPGTYIAVHCYQLGTATPYGANQMWVQASWASGPGTGQGWVNEHFVNDGAPINQAASGVPACDGSSPPPSSQGDPAVWVGAPFDGNWPDASGCPAAIPSVDCSLPRYHHTPYGGDWAADITTPSGPGTPVVLYAAPQNSGLIITARVDRVAPACGSGRISDGGYVVTVGLYYGASRVGWVAYAHLNPSVSAGQSIGRWGTRLGTVGRYTYGSCWKGAHVHIELYSTHHYACYNKGYAPGQRFSATNFLGFVGGAFASGPRQACP